MHPGETVTLRDGKQTVTVPQLLTYALCYQGDDPTVLDDVAVTLQPHETVELRDGSRLDAKGLLLRALSLMARRQQEGIDRLSETHRYVSLPEDNRGLLRPSPGASQQKLLGGTDLVVPSLATAVVGTHGGLLDLTATPPPSNRATSSAASEPPSSASASVRTTPLQLAPSQDATPSTTAANPAVATGGLSSIDQLVLSSPGASTVALFGANNLKSYVLKDLGAVMGPFDEVDIPVDDIFASSSSSTRWRPVASTPSSRGTPPTLPIGTGSSSAPTVRIGRLDVFRLALCYEPSNVEAMTYHSVVPPLRLTPPNSAKCTPSLRRLSLVSLSKMIYNARGVAVQDTDCCVIGVS